VNEAVDAKEKLRVLWQGSLTIPEYATLFKELMTRTSYSSADLRDRFYEHLSTRIKDKLVHTTCPIAALDQLITVATDLDVRIRQRQAKREREKKRTGTITGIVAPQPPSSNVSALFTPPVADPVAMDIDAAHTREEFMQHMHGKCFECGSSTHAKKDGSHKRDLCPYCKCVGHRETVCMDKFLGRPKGQKAAATGEEEASDSEVSDILSQASLR